MNLSKHQLTTSQIEVLALGLGFCPERNHVLFDTIKDFKLFIRKLTLKAPHHKTDQSPSATSALMQLLLSEFRELRELLLSDSQDIPSSPTPLLAALEAMVENSTSEPVPTTDPPPVVPPNLADLKCKSKTPPSPQPLTGMHIYSFGW